MSHHHHGCGDDHDHDHEKPDMGIMYSLYTRVDTDNVECLNESVDGSGKTVLKPWEDRLDTVKFVQSDADEELLFNIPFTGNVKLKGIIVRGGTGDAHPSKLRIFKNRPKMTFDDARGTADQEYELMIDSDGSLEYQTKVVKFSSVYHLTLHFPTNFGADETVIYYIGLRGEYTKGHHHGVTICNYELRPNLSDHKGSLFDQVNQNIGK